MTNGFNIIGIAVRTTNQNNQAQQDLGNLWGKFFADGIFDKIPNKSSNDIFAIYTDYKSNYTEEYTTIIGVPVTELSHIPEGLIGRAFGASEFEKYIAKGEMPNAVVEVWQKIWQNDQTLKRAYQYDFEVYGAKSQNGENSEVEIYLSLNK